jgi:hypothetical protein
MDPSPMEKFKKIKKLCKTRYGEVDLVETKQD